MLALKRMKIFVFGLCVLVLPSFCKCFCSHVAVEAHEWIPKVLYTLKKPKCKHKGSLILLSYPFCNALPLCPYLSLSSLFLFSHLLSSPLFLWSHLTLLTSHFFSSRCPPPFSWSVNESDPSAYWDLGLHLFEYNQVMPYLQDVSTSDQPLPAAMTW